MLGCRRACKIYSSITGKVRIFVHFKYIFFHSSHGTYMEGISEIGAHAEICLKHSFISTAVANLKLFSKKIFFLRMCAKWS